MTFHMMLNQPNEIGEKGVKILDFNEKQVKENHYRSISEHLLLEL